MKKILSLLLILIMGFGFAQNQRTQIKLDSLEAKLSEVKNDSVKLSILLGLGKDYALHSNKKNFEFNQKAIELAKNLNKSMAIAEAYGNYGYYYERKNDTLKQLELLDKIIELGNKEKNNDVLGKGYYEKGFYYWGRSSQTKTIQNFLKAEEFFTKSKNKKYLSEVFIQLGYYYQEDIRDYNKALEYYKKYTDLFDENSFALVTTYDLMAELYGKQNKYEKSLEYYKLSEKMYKQNKETKGFHYGLLLSNIANIYDYLKDYKTSLDYYDASLKCFLEIEDYRVIPILYIHKATIYKKLNQSEKVFENINFGWKNSEKITHCLSREDFYTKTGYLYFDMKNYVEALQLHLKAYRECDLNEPYKDLETQEYNIGATYLMLAKNIEQITNSSVEIPKDRNKLLQLSEEYLQKTKKSSQLKHNLSGYTRAVNSLHEVYDLLGNKTKALEYYKEYITFKDSLKSIENRELLVQNQMQFEFDQQEKIRLAEQETKDALTREEIAKEKSRRNMALAGVGVFVILAGFAGFAYSQKRKDNKIIAREKQKSDDLLLNILPEEVANELKEKGTSDAKHFESVSIMFTDFKDFTKLSEKIPSKELIEELNYCFKAFDEIVAKHGVEKIKTIGDSYMAVCGLPAKYGNHAQKMIQAALEIRDFIEDYKTKRQNEGKSFFEMRIGINSGEVVAGIVGIKKFAYDIWGDAVNTASRMESNGEIGKINISESTYNLVKDDFDFQYRGEIETKGKGEIKMYFVEDKTKNMDFEKAKAFILEKLEKELPKNLKYHNIGHILDVYEASIRYAQLEDINDGDTTLLKTASLFHDSGFIVQAEGHEQISCDIAQKHLPDFGYTQEQIDKIKGMIMATKIPQSPNNHLEEMLADSDLDYLGRDDFEGISNGLFEELKAENKVSDINTWNKIQISFFEKHSYFTESAKRLRNEKKQENLDQIKKQTTN